MQLKIQLAVCVSLERKCIIFSIKFLSFLKMFRPWEKPSTSRVNNYPESSEVNSNKQEVKRNILSVDAKKVIFDVYTSLCERRFSKFGAVQEAAALTRKPVTTVWSIVNKPIVNRKKRKDW